MNTAALLKAVRQGADSVGCETEYVDLYDLQHTGCRSCLACKRQGIAEPCRCYWRDGLTPLLDTVYDVEHLVIGSPIYYSQTTSAFRALLERVCFPAMTYDDYTSTCRRTIDVDIWLTMNVEQSFYEAEYAKQFERDFQPFRFLNGKTTIHPVFDTKQVKDYAAYRLGSFDPVHKSERHERQFPLDLAAAFTVGASF